MNDKNAAAGQAQAVRRTMIPKRIQLSDHGGDDREGHVGVRGAGALGKQPDRQKATTSRNKAGVAFCVDEGPQAQSSGANAPRQAQ
ncbi:hypothetical protein FJV83_03835 [Mesorhizobium sp. WSM4307]|uniref:hypothetical protein n=1 Tax=Mesorhizobium sp. WSM4307 TaxID=2589884 RepID=UPI00115CC062|nr:hypothetical protein [Mesorhizobium sp. WSM4307]TRC74048.1 hypothetical protein FJV81_21815 [Mesorhizobium sp. WSM4315]TRC87068.1 hypothetical protein FJV83_03835 [Mesorhizobium sp. WSM4307]